MRLVALFDHQHLNHEAAHDWFARKGIDFWAPCPITENGFLQVISNPAYPTVMATPMEAADRLAKFCSSTGHMFWPDEISLLGVLSDTVKKRLLGHGQITDFYLARDSRTPAAIAEPRTPATFGPMAFISRKLEGLAR